MLFLESGSVEIAMLLLLLSWRVLMRSVGCLARPSTL